MIKKVVAIHQPNFLPWLGYFHKISQSDIFVFLDDVEYTKNSFINRNRIKTPNGESWITLPVAYSGKSTQKIQECRIAGKDKAVKKILGQILHNYRQANHFSEYYGTLAGILGAAEDTLADLNIELIKWISDIFNLKTRFIRSSELDIHAGDATDRLIKICQSLDGNVYLSGSGGINYQDEERFIKNGVGLELSSFRHPEYNQLWGEFMANLSMIDYLLNQGPTSFLLV